MPDKPEGVKSDQPRQSRRAEYELYGHPYDDPPWPEKKDHVIDWLVGSGMVSQGGMGPAPITWVEFQAYCRMTGVVPDPQDAKRVIQLSGRYISRLNEYKSRDSQPPYRTEETEEALKELAIKQKAIKAKLKALAN